MRTFLAPAVPLFPKTIAKISAICLNLPMPSVTTKLYRHFAVGLAAGFCLFPIWVPVAAGAAGPGVSLVLHPNRSMPEDHGWVKIRQSLQQRGTSVQETTSFEKVTGETVIVAGLPTADKVAELLAELRLTPPQAKESLLVRKFTHGGKSTVLVTGSDPTGLMYGLLDVAERVGWAKAGDQPLSEVRDSTESPYAPERALSLYTFNRAYWESRFYDEAYWGRYLDLLAQNRFNSLVVIFGYENGGFLAPCYPYFFNVESFPDVRMVGITPEQQRRNLEALNRLIQMAHDRGIKFKAGIWDHIYRGGVQGGGIPGADEATKGPVPVLVWGVTGENLVPYTKAALAEFVKRVPALDAIQFRMHDESGLKNTEQEAFWRDVFRMMKQAAPHLQLDLRAKGLPDSVIQSAIDTGVPFRVTTKYWMEQMGLPFHPTHINRQNQFDRRHGYADMLRYPQTYKMHWRLWNGGTARVLLWGDPDYARRFAESSRLYDGDGFEVNEPLCTKMEAQPHDSRPFNLLSPSRRYYDYEFERYWHFFEVFGRIGYNTNTAAEVWQREFLSRFGEAGPLLERGLHQASWILPRIVASCYPYSAFPMTRGWAEKQRLGELPDFAKAEGSDTQQFVSFDEEAQLLLQGGESAKLRPGANSRWFAGRAEEIAMLVAEAQKIVGGRRNKEFASTVTDLAILANLARFHSHRIPAAVNYRLFERTKSPRSLAEAIKYETRATEAWRQLVAAAGDFYTDDLMMGVRTANLCGHWKDELGALQKGVVDLERRQVNLKPASSTTPSPVFDPGAVAGDGRPPQVSHQPVLNGALGKPLAIKAEVHDPAGVKWVRLRYRSVNQHQDFRTIPMIPNAEANMYEAAIPAQDILPTWDLMYFIEAMDRDGNGAIFPDLDKETPYFIVKLKR